MGTITGNSNYAVAVAVAKTGATGSEQPDTTDDVYYFHAKRITVNGKALDRFIHSAIGLNIRYPTGKRGISVKITGCHIPPDVTATSTQELDLIEDFIYNSSIKAGASKVYLFVKHHGDNRWKKLSWDSSHNHVQYLLGQFKDWKSDLTGDEYVWKLDFTFEEATTPSS
jgi:hypothetical protein